MRSNGTQEEEHMFLFKTRKHAKNSPHRTSILTTKSKVVYGKYFDPRNRPRHPKRSTRLSARLGTPLEERVARHTTRSTVPRPMNVDQVAVIKGKGMSGKRRAEAVGARAARAKARAIVSREERQGPCFHRDGKGNVKARCIHQV